MFHHSSNATGSRLVVPLGKIRTLDEITARKKKEDVAIRRKESIKSNLLSHRTNYVFLKSLIRPENVLTNLLLVSFLCHLISFYNLNLNLA